MKFRETRWPPTDLEILKEIYRRHYSTFVSFQSEPGDRTTKVYVPIDIKELAQHFHIDADIIFGRLYYHLEPKYGFRNADVHFFALRAGTDSQAIQFPLLASVISQLRAERAKHLVATALAIVAILISLVSLGVSLVAR